nr:MAG TPA: phosphoadenosine-phosphosulfate reductase [Caudoviricetes sp.]
MLIESPRLTAADRIRWAELERYDTIFAADRRWPVREAKAHDVIRSFADAGPCYASTSWGKDSTVVAHLAATSGIKLPLVYVRMRTYESPESLLVRDAFMDVWGDNVDYHEFWVDAGPRWWDDIELKERKGPHAKGQFDAPERDFGPRHITGVRAEESRLRDMVIARWGEAGPGACRPIGRWTAVDVFAYLKRHDLPVHPAYAMSCGGRYDRRWLRVSPIGGITQAHHQRSGWESTYYPDIIGKAS